MPDKTYDVVGIGNAIVDIIARCDDGFLSKHDLAKGSMRLIDAEEANRLYAAMGPAVERSGGKASDIRTSVGSSSGPRRLLHDLLDYGTPRSHHGGTGGEMQNGTKRILIGAVFFGAAFGMVAAASALVNAAEKLVLK